VNCTDPTSKLRVEDWRTSCTGNEIVSTIRQQLSPCLTWVYGGIRYKRTSMFVEKGSAGHNELISVLTAMIYHHLRFPIHQIIFIHSESTPHVTNIFFHQALLFNFQHTSGIIIHCRAFIQMREFDNTLLLYTWHLCSDLCFPFFVFIVIITGSACVITKRVSVESKRGANFTESWEVFIPSLSFFFNICFTISDANDVSQLDITFRIYTFEKAVRCQIFLCSLRRYG